MTQRESTPMRFEESRRIPAPPEDVFAFISDIRNLPSYLPTTTWAEPQGEDRVRLAGQAGGKQYEDDGYLRCDEGAMRMEWGADEHHYSGEMQISPDGDGSHVTVRLNFRERPKDGRPSGGPSEADIREGLRKALQSIENQVTGRGGKVEPRAAG
jgi:uncharacterized protein YndB with AHSA1/START domain